jgi:hypothetical protein
MTGTDDNQDDDAGPISYPLNYKVGGIKFYWYVVAVVVVAFLLGKFV